jgi:hypothetical protein
MGFLLLFSGVLWLTFPVLAVIIARNRSARAVLIAWLVVGGVTSIVQVVALRSAPPNFDFGWVVFLLFVVGIGLLPTGSAAWVARRRSRRVPSAWDFLFAYFAFLAGLVVGAFFASFPDVIQVTRG